MLLSRHKSIVFTPLSVKVWEHAVFNDIYRINNFFYFVLASFYTFEHVVVLFSSHSLGHDVLLWLICELFVACSK